jgi:fibronectin type 3 domain-containing protein
VVLSQPIPDTSSLKLSWSPSTEIDFANYRLYRFTSSPVDTSFAPITIINNQAQTEFRDFSVVPNLLYYYRLFVFDRFGLAAGSNEVQGRLSR